MTSPDSIAVAGPTPLELRLLGGVDLRAGTNTVTSVLAQPKRLALLTYLAVSRPDGFHSRDHLLGVFWPDADESHARASLRQALRFLRTSLVDGAILRRGNDHIGLSTDHVGCDAVRFRSAVEAGQLKPALDVYAGDFLDGFLVSGIPAFEQWVEAERRGLRTMFVDAAVGLSRLVEADGDAQQALEFARRAAQADSFDEVVARQVILLLHATGNRSAAIAEYDALSARLRADYDLLPSRETAQLVASIRTGESPSDGPARRGAAGPRLRPGRIVVADLENRVR